MKKHVFNYTEARSILEARAVTRELQPASKIKDRVYEPIAINKEVLIVTDGTDQFVFYYYDLDKYEVRDIALNYIGGTETAYKTSSGRFERDEDGQPVVDVQTEYERASDLSTEPGALSDYLSEIYPDPNDVPVGASEFEAGNTFVKMDNELKTELKDTYTDLNF